MRSLIASLICIIVIVVSWCIFMSFSGRVIAETIDFIDNSVYQSIVDGDWDSADEQIFALQKLWREHRNNYMFFIHQSTLFDIDTTLSQAIAYTDARSKDQAMGELLALRTQLILLHQSETLTWGNII